MTNGLLKVDGTIDLDQFWPKNTADADTTKILVTVGGDDISFRPSPEEEFRITHVFDDVTVVGRGGARRPAINKGKITIRLQGIDATELHYCPAAAKKFKKPLTEEQQEQHNLYLEWNLSYRQCFAETATVELHTMLARGGQNPLSCRVATAVDEPEQVFDVYGRMVADILVNIGGKEVNINQWLVESGYALPAFYNCMSNNEINALLECTRTAQHDRSGLWDDLYTSSIPDFDWDRVCRPKGSVFDPEKDKGKAIMPKLFRRQAAYEVNKRALMVTGTFKKYLKSGKDGLYRTGDFLANGNNAKTIYLDSLVAYNTVKMAPEEIVFKEDTNVTLKKPDNAPVVWWAE
jgi:endonuclease YncB( thermonuclease family)